MGPSAHAAVSVVGQINNPRPYFSYTSSSTLGASPATGVVGFGAGALLEWRWTRWIGIEVGGIYGQRHHKTRIASRGTGVVLGSPYTIDTTLNSSLQSFAVEIPVVLRIRLGRYLSLGGGVYYGYGLGHLRVTSSTSTTVYYSDRTYAGTTTDEQIMSFEKQQLHRSDYGWVGVLGFSIPLGKSIALILDGRYLHGIKNLSTAPDTTLRWRGIEALVGFRFGNTRY